MTLQEILKLMEKKHPSECSKGINPVLFLYDDGSGRILKNSIESPFAHSNILYNFEDVESLIAHLESNE